MTKLDVWMSPANRIVLSPWTAIPVGAREHPEDWKLLGSLQMTDAPQEKENA